MFHIFTQMEISLVSSAFHDKFYYLHVSLYRHGESSGLYSLNSLVALKRGEKKRLTLKFRILRERNPPINQLTLRGYWVFLNIWSHMADLFGVIALKEYKRYEAYFHMQIHTQMDI